MPRRYLDGHRQPYLSPLRLAVAASIALLLGLAILLPTPERITAETTIAQDLATLASGQATALTIVHFLTLPLVALLLPALFAGTGTLYLAHLVFVFCFHAAFCTALLFAVLLAPLNTDFAFATGLALMGVLFGPCLLVALKRFYGCGWVRTAAAWPEAGLAYITLALFVLGVFAGVLAVAEGPVEA